MKKICILGEDERSKSLRDLYIKDKHNLVSYEEADYIITPIPFSRDNKCITYTDIDLNEIIFSLKNKSSKLLITGSINNLVKEKLDKNNIKYIDIMNIEEFVDKNALATAEGTIKVIMENTDKTINGLDVAVVGYGRIAKHLISMLKSLNSNVTVFARKEEALKEAKKIYKVEALNTSEMSNKGMVTSSVIVNTVPAMLFNKEVLNNIPKDAIIIDVASAPGGVDIAESKKLKINVQTELGIPSRYSPYSAAEYIKCEIDNIINKE